MRENLAIATGLGDLVGLVGLSSQPQSKGVELSNSVSEMFKAIRSFIDELLTRAIASQTQAEFESVRHELFAPYAKTLKSQAALVRLLVRAPVIENLLRESFCELESDLRDSALTRFGSAARDQAMFTVWTLRRTSGLITKIATSGSLNADEQKTDQELAKEYSFYAMWAQFHMDCLIASIRKDRSIQLEVLPSIIDGLRAAVNAYSLARQGLDLRCPQPEVIVARSEWDEEDKELLASSMEDMSYMEEAVEAA